MRPHVTKKLQYGKEQPHTEQPIEGKISLSITYMIEGQVSKVCKELQKNKPKQKGIHAKQSQ